MTITLKNVSFSYSDSLDDAVIKNLNFEIKSGECVVLVGESGCGKTTISKLINGLIPLYQSGTMAGDVLLGDKNTADMTLAEISRHVGSVFQNPRSQFFNIDTDSEIAFGCENLGMDPEEIRERVDRVVKEFHIEHLAGRNIFHLSGGEKQKIACASVSATDPEIFVLDEPSANLDLKTVADLAEIIKFWKSRGKTVVIVEHRIHYLREIADRICYVKDGCIAHEWTPAELEANGPEYAATLGLRCMNLEQLKNKVPEHAEGPESSKEPAKRTLKESLLFSNLHFAYNRKFPVLDIPELSLPRNQITAIIGHNGAGKSTLAQVLCGLRGTWRQKRKARKYGAYLIMQDVNHQLFTESVLDEILLGMNPQDENIALEILERLNLKEYASCHPMALSGGQKQRVAIGSGVSSGREIVVFDEPTSGLDYRQMLAVSATLKKLATSGKTLLVITHDPEFILNCCQSVIRMEHGKIAEQYLLQGNQEKLIESMIELPWNAF
ncbi:MAG: ABC transporter ATP-binding protein [Fibrobacter sp.]|uniref:ABC transporter ATP-binding protein n=1 Tax=Fibrobacter sp. TaxID=35828 RepID=UPI002A91E736|nr:ABC transporter ATP-binding protein [Fibrobacter sp.]MBR6125555.1 ABC transporter ATP-binding protein [Candidatus Saccharibacteria bacterium]MDY6263272.1 ABC transporter ATP-binding protein [Fibrobacter sp.]